MQNGGIGWRHGLRADGHNGRSAIIMPSDENNPADKDPGASAPRSEESTVPHLRVTDLLGRAKEAILEHEGQLYRLRITSNRKLILTK
jgi:hemin uptake protein HemP